MWRVFNAFSIIRNGYNKTYGKSKFLSHKYIYFYKKALQVLLCDSCKDYFDPDRCLEKNMFL